MTDRLLTSDPPRAWRVLPLVRLMVGAVFVSEGLLKFLFPANLGPFRVRSLDTYGFWSMAHEMRTDWAMLLGSLVLVYAGGGPWAVDRRLGREEP